MEDVLRFFLSPALILEHLVIRLCLYRFIDVILRDVVK